jgi:hypothetical protein
LKGLALAVCVCGIAQAAYVGSEACAECHAAEFNRQTHSHHAQALRPIADSPLRGIGIGLEWAFGAGAQGITPVGRLDGQYFENRLSYYARLHGTATTFGHAANAATPIAKLGVLQNNKTITHCFMCHATDVRASPEGPDLHAMQPGVQCERCHGPGSAHIAAAKAGLSPAAIQREVLNPGRLGPVAQAQVCGECHRIAGPDAGDEPELENPVTVRFAPVGLMASRCFRESKTLTCLTCHDPHENARPQTDSAYSTKCMSCHAKDNSPVKLCHRKEGPVAGNCLTCHMQQASLGPYLRFTDHRIRVY